MEKKYAKMVKNKIQKQLSKENFVNFDISKPIRDAIKYENEPALDYTIKIDMELGHNGSWEELKECIKIVHHKVVKVNKAIIISNNIFTERS